MSWYENIFGGKKDETQVAPTANPQAPAAKSSDPFDNTLSSFRLPSFSFGQNRSSARQERTVPAAAPVAARVVAVTAVRNDDALISYATGRTELPGQASAGPNHLFRGVHNLGGRELTLQLQQGVSFVTNGTQPRYGADGIFGASTENAVVALQAQYGLRQDGIAGKNVVTALQVEEARVLINQFKANGLTGPEQQKIALELADVKTMLDGGGRLGVRGRAKLAETLDGLKEATGGQDVSQGALGATIAALRQATRQR